MPDQLSLFAAGMRPPGLADLDGLLAGPGQAVRRGRTARLSVLLDEQWRVDALLAAFAEVGIAAEAVDAGVRTGWSTALAPVAARWVRGAVKQPPVGFTLDGPRLRLWAVCAGQDGPGGYLLRLGASDDAVWPGVGAALATAGVPATFVRPRALGPGYRVTGRRRLVRLRELLGEPPPAAAGNNGWVSVS